MAVSALNGAETYEVHVNGDVYFGTIIEQPDGVMVRFIEDAKWKETPLERSFRADQVEYFRESSTNRARRHKEGWESRGYVNAGRNDDDAYWVRREEADLARRAAVMVEDLGLTQRNPPPVPPLDSLDDEIYAAPGGGVTEYLPHALLVLVGVALAGVVTRFLILPG